MGIVKDNWELIASNPWFVISLALMFSILGWKAATLFYKERIELLKEKSNGNNQTLSEPEFFDYPQSGRYGKNVLSNSVQSINKNEKVALRSEIPKKSRLLIIIKGPDPQHKSDTGGSWQFSLSKKSNWTTSTYEFENGGRQEFTAENGTADMELEFTRSGNVTFSVFEGEEKNASWEKEITIKE
jgi:hypothetical protein